MFYKTGIDITNDKQMFNFLKNHFRYNTMNSWNRVTSIANNVKLYKLGLSGDWGVAYDLLVSGEYDTLQWMIHDWCLEHPGYEIFFNGRSGGYLVLMETAHNGDILPYVIAEADDYEDYKYNCREYCGSVKANHDDLVFYTKLVRDFDRLCDELSSYCDELSKLDISVVKMRQAVETFNEEYSDDLELLGFSGLVCEEGSVNIGDIQTLCCLMEAFSRIAECPTLNLHLKYIDQNNVVLSRD